MTIREQTILFLLYDEVREPYNTPERVVHGIQMTGITHILVDWTIWHQDFPHSAELMKRLRALKAANPAYQLGAHFVPRVQFGPVVDNRRYLEEDIKLALTLGLKDFVYSDGAECFDIPLNPNDPKDRVRWVQYMREYVIRLNRTFGRSLSSSWHEVADVVFGFGSVDQHSGYGEHMTLHQYITDRLKWIEDTNNSIVPNWYRKDFGWFGEKITSAAIAPTPYSDETYARVFEGVKALRDKGIVAGITLWWQAQRLAKCDEQLNQIRRLDEMLGG